MTTVKPNANNANGPKPNQEPKSEKGLKPLDREVVKFWQKAIK